MWFTRLKTVAVLLLVLTVLGTGGGVAMHRIFAAPSDASEDEQGAGPAAKAPGGVPPVAVAQPQDDPAKKIRELQQERIATLKTVADQLMQQFQSGRGTFDEVLQARQQLLKAELEMTENDRDRVKICEKTAELLRQLERIAEQQARAGLAQASLPLKAKAARLEAEIELERAKIQAAKKAK